MTLAINHDLKFKKFYANIDGKQCWLKYSIKNGIFMELEVLFIPISLRGVGLAKKMIEQAISYAEKNFLKIIPQCSYIRSFFEVNFQYNHLMHVSNFDFHARLNYN
ncbi:MAG TPA: GNAT family N-acetyltransferase [Cytophagaceae bacterium]|jgi:hypothetical protein